MNTKEQHNSIRHRVTRLYRLIVPMRHPMCHSTPLFCVLFSLLGSVALKN